MELAARMIAAIRNAAVWSAAAVPAAMGMANAVLMPAIIVARNARRARRVRIVAIPRSVSYAAQRMNAMIPWQLNVVMIPYRAMLIIVTSSNSKNAVTMTVAIKKLRIAAMILKATTTAIAFPKDLNAAWAIFAIRLLNVASRVFA